MKHFDEARRDATESLDKLLSREASIRRAVLIDDVFGRIRVVLWLEPGAAPDLADRVSAQMTEAAGPYWSGDLWIAVPGSDADQELYEAAWVEGTAISARLRRTDRYRSKRPWLQAPTEPLWPVLGGSDGPPVISFYSFKGGVGRTTALCSLAIQRARVGDRVVVLDLDLDAPGVGTLLTSGTDVPGAQWGVVDYLLERPIVPRVDLRDYYHACAREAVTGAGEILVVPAGRMDEGYLEKLARIDLDPPPSSKVHPLGQLLLQVREELEPNWLLLDCRAGLSEAAGSALRGLAHLNVLFGAQSEQSWQGLRLVIERLGAQRVKQDQPQAECLLVQAMVPANPETGTLTESAFAASARDEFAEAYYAEDPDDPEEDRFWYVRDGESEDAPHVPIPIHYSEALAFVKSIDHIADELANNPDYQRLAARIVSRFSPEDF